MPKGSSYPIADSLDGAYLLGIKDGTKRFAPSLLDAAVNLDIFPAEDEIVITNTHGDGVVIPLATETEAGLLSPAEKAAIADIPGAGSGVYRLGEMHASGEYIVITLDGVPQDFGVRIVKLPA